MSPAPNARSIACLVLLIVIALIAFAGCTDSAGEQGGQGTPATTGVNDNHHAVTEAITVKTPSAQKTAQPMPTPGSSTGVIRIDAISGKTTGEKFTLTGTTSLPEETNIFLQIMPDTGTPPTGLDPDSMMSVGGNYRVTKGEGTMNRIALSVDLGQLIPGNYVAIVGKMKGDPGSAPVFEIDKDYGYAYFTLK
ncbi:hypothetical protein [Methanoregula formicica]|uniref:Uncharacterized protein n=1 Tax=Methanoregula formicica (strain DSM 22288 / NBRC 105244 / SMSP) TaxID=593750 RepID=L0HGF5_METFS|nr:hypothetical protein [Methanoregula formicica]AGB03095.1 hypothetical protein Metfor_2088 [Methanoregula formicica SMSP]